MSETFTIFKYTNKRSKELDNIFENDKIGRLDTINEIINCKYGRDLPLIQKDIDDSYDYEDCDINDYMEKQYQLDSSNSILVLKEFKFDIQNVTTQQASEAKGYREVTEEELKAIKIDCINILSAIENGFCYWYK